MANITGIWEELPDSGCKPVVVYDCERIERDIIRAQKRLQDLYRKQHIAYEAAILDIHKSWSQGEVRKAKGKARVAFDYDNTL